MHNRNHTGPINSVGVLEGYLATGSTSSFDVINKHAPGCIQIWELETGRCVNVLGPIDCGFISDVLVLLLCSSLSKELNLSSSRVAFFGIAKRGTLD